LVWLTSCPWPASVLANFRVLLQVHRNGDIGSPRVVGSTNASNVATNSGTVADSDFRPRPAIAKAPQRVMSGIKVEDLSLSRKREWEQERIQKRFYAYIHDGHERPCPFSWYRIGQGKLESPRMYVHARL
jgi:hypothetical protein